jgi:serine/threonine-protein kinase
VAGPQARLDAALGDHYSITREVGSGGMAAALGADRFPREIRIVTRFQHPHILSLYHSGETQGFLYYVMPFVDGESLADRLAREKQLPIADAVRIFREVDG